MEKYDNKETYNSKILLLILGTLTILIALIGATFAYFTAVVKKTNGNQSVVLTTATIQGLSYESSNPIMLRQADPGAVGTSKITIHNPNASAAITYNMKIVTDINEFETTDGTNQLLLTVSGAKIPNSITIDLTNGNDKSDKKIVNDVKLKAGETDLYDVKAEFVDIGKNQNTNQGKTFVGHIVVEQSLITQN